MQGAFVRLYHLVRVEQPVLRREDEPSVGYALRVGGARPEKR